MEKSAYRYASITLAIIVLIPRSNAAWIVALHRFFEVSVGIVVALALAAVWPEHQPESAKQSADKLPGRLENHSLTKERASVVKFVSRREQRADLGPA